jgi:hypothetical protein
VKAIFDIAALPICDIVPAAANAGLESRIVDGWLVANLRIGDGVTRDAAAIGRRESEPGSRMLLIQDRNRIAGRDRPRRLAGRQEFRSVLKVA